MAVDVYTFTGQFPATGGGGARDDIFRIVDAGRTMQIKSITFDWMSFEAATPAYFFPANPHPDQRVYFEVGTPLATPKVIGAAFQRVTAVSTQIYNGNAFRIFSAGQYLFQSFFCSEEIGFRVYIQVVAGSPLVFNTAFNFIVETVSEINF